MKKNILIIIIGLVSYFCTYSFPREFPSGCEDEEFPYLFCNSNNLTHKCSKNPYNKRSEVNPNTILKPMKLKCFIYDSENSDYAIENKTVEHHEIVIEVHYEIIAYDPETGDPIWGYYDGNPIYYIGTDDEIDLGEIETGDPIYGEYETHEDVVTYVDEPCNADIYDDDGNIVLSLSLTNANWQEAESTWKNICSDCTLNNQYMQDCCIHAIWSKDATKFTEKKYRPEETAAVSNNNLTENMLPPSSVPCAYDCEKIKTYLNQSIDFTGSTEKDPCFYSNHFFFTGSTTKEGWYSLKAVFMHEIGHLLGFDDQDVDADLPCKHSGSIIDNTDFEDPDRGLSEDDICMYMKLYCWEPPASYEESTVIEADIKIYPNPTDDDLLSINFNNPLGIELRYEIVSPLGTSVQKGVQLPNENPKTIMLENIHSGIYFIIFNYDNKQEIKKFIVNN